jgi:CTP synthase
MELINDFSTSVKKAFDDIDPDWEKYDGLVICGTHSPKNTDDIIEKIRVAREKLVPFLGICAGLQLAVIEFARTVWGIKDATSEEFGKGTFIVRKLPKLQVGIKEVLYPSFTMAYGGGNASFGQWFSFSRSEDTRNESFWHNYAVGEPYITKLADSGFVVSGNEEDDVLNLIYTKPSDHPFFVATQFHPEYESSKENPHPILEKFLEASRANTEDRRKFIIFTAMNR